METEKTLSILKTKLYNPINISKNSEKKIVAKVV